MQTKNKSKSKKAKTAGISPIRVGMIVTVAVLLVFGWIQYREQEADLNRIHARTDLIAQESERVDREYNTVLAERQRVETDEYVEEYAREHLGMVKPGEIIFKAR